MYTADLKSREENSLAEWREETIQEYGITEARHTESRLCAVPANHIKNTPNQAMPGSVFKFWRALYSRTK